MQKIAYNPRAEKRALRQKMTAVRALANEALPNAAESLKEQILSNFDFSEHQTVAFYYPVKSEISPMPLINKLYLSSISLCLPTVSEHKRPMLFREWTPDTKLMPNEWGIGEPSESPEAEPDVILVPLLAFDRHYKRLGYGGGFYDRTISHLRKRKNLIVIGLGFSAQEVESVPTDRNDASMDAIATEAYTIKRS